MRSSKFKDIEIWNQQYMEKQKRTVGCFCFLLSLSELVHSMQHASKKEFSTSYLFEKHGTSEGSEQFQMSLSNPFGQIEL